MHTIKTLQPQRGSQLDSDDIEIGSICVYIVSVIRLCLDSVRTLLGLRFRNVANRLAVDYLFLCFRLYLH